MLRLLSTLATHNLLRFPVHLEKRERPDYRLATDNSLIGCEITEAINEEYVRAQSLPEAGQGNSLKKSVTDPSLFKWGQKRRSLKELRKIVSRDKLTGSGWVGNCAEHEYAQIICDVVQRKTYKMHKVGYELFDKNWLLIYCNQPLPKLDVQESSKLCSEKLSSYWNANAFDAIFVEEGGYIVRYAEQGFHIMQLNDLWNNQG